MLKIAILYVCVGSYTVFWDDFYKSFEEKFIPNAVKEYFVFTDSKDLFDCQNNRVHLIKQEKSWMAGKYIIPISDVFNTKRKSKAV